MLIRRKINACLNHGSTSNKRRVLGRASRYMTLSSVVVRARVCARVRVVVEVGGGDVCDITRSLNRQHHVFCV